MIKQGEKVGFKGKFRQKINEQWVEIPDITSYKMLVKILNPINNININLSTIDNTITILSDKKTYEFFLTPKQSASMLGECTCEMALLDNNDNPILTETKTSFIINASSLGRELAKR